MGVYCITRSCFRFAAVVFLSSSEILGETTSSNLKGLFRSHAGPYNSKGLPEGVDIRELEKYMLDHATPQTPPGNLSPLSYTGDREDSEREFRLEVTKLMHRINPITKTIDHMGQTHRPTKRQFTSSAPLLLSNTIEDLSKPATTLTSHSATEQGASRDVQPSQSANHERKKSAWYRASQKDTSASDKLARHRRDQIKAAMQHTWRGYRELAWGSDTVRPLSGEATNNWGRMGMMILDSLDTLWLMGMDAEFIEGADFIRSTSLNFSNAGKVSVFETTIRALGGLLSAHGLSKDNLFANRAQELAELLMPAFQTPTGLPIQHLHLAKGGGALLAGKSNFGTTTLADAGSLRLEFGRLSVVSDESKFDKAAARAQEFFHDRFLFDRAKTAARGDDGTQVQNGLFPVLVHPDTGAFEGGFSFGAFGDSFYEYLLKCWVAQGRDRNSPLLQMYEAAVKGLREHMIRVSQPNGLKYVTSFGNKMEHLSCFVPAMLALGAHVRPWVATRDEEFSLAEDLATTCYEMYRRMPTGLSPEMVVFGESQEDFEADRQGGNLWNRLRPEAVESFFVLHELTGDPKYREWGHEVFEAFQNFSLTQHGYGAFPDVTNALDECCKGKYDVQPTFFAAETLKYLYLLQDTDHQISLDKYVFNTEGHPFPLNEVMPSGFYETRPIHKEEHKRRIEVPKRERNRGHTNDADLKEDQKKTLPASVQPLPELRRVAPQAQQRVDQAQQPVDQAGTNSVTSRTKDEEATVPPSNGDPMWGDNPHGDSIYNDGETSLVASAAYSHIPEVEVHFQSHPEQIDGGVGGGGGEGGKKGESQESKSHAESSFRSYIMSLACLGSLAMFL